VDLTNAATLAAAGATMLVAGVSIFGTANPGEATQALRRAAQAGA
jgi:pentose-5-phosphate-3-epimerase